MPAYTPAQLAAWLSPSQWARTGELQRSAVDVQARALPEGGLEVEGLFPKHGRRSSRFRFVRGQFHGECPCKPSGACAHVGALALLGLKAQRRSAEGEARAWEAQLAAWLPPEAPPGHTPWTARLAWRGVPGLGRSPALLLGLGQGGRFQALPWAQFKAPPGAPAHEVALHELLATQGPQAPKGQALPLPGPRLGEALLVLARWPRLEDEDGRPLRLRFDAPFRGLLHHEGLPQGAARLVPQLLGPEGPLAEAEALSAFGEAPFLWGHHQGLIAPLDPSALLAQQGEAIALPPEAQARFRKGQQPRLVALGLLPQAAEPWPKGEAQGELVLTEEGEGLRLGLAFAYATGRVAHDDPTELVGPAGGPFLRRDRAGEAAFLKQVETFGAVPGLLGPDQALAFLGDRLPAWQAAGRRLAGAEALKRFRLADGEAQGHLSWRREGKAWALRPRLSGPGGAQAQGPELLAALRQGRRFVRLDDGAWAPLPAEWAQAMQGLLALSPKGGRAAQAGEALLPLAHLGALEAAQSLPGSAPATPEDAARLAQLKAAPQAPASEGEAPSAFVGQLRPYQAQGLAFLRRLRDAGLGGVLADDMGLGKTAQAIALLAERQSGDGPDLVVCPASVLPNWQSELTRFAPSLRVVAHHGPQRDPAALAQAEVVLTTHALARLDAETLQATPWRHLVLDEAQALKNAASQSAQALRQLPAQHRWALSGTPLENHAGELWAVFHQVLPELLGSAARFQEDFGQALQSPDLLVRDEALARLRHRIAPFLLRRLKQEVAPELPPRIERLLWCPLLPGQAEAYQALRQDSLQALSAWEAEGEGGSGKARLQALAQLTRLRQACCHPKLLGLPECEGLPSGKLEAALALLAELKANGHRALVFSQFTGFLALVREALERKGWTYRYLDGGTRQRGEVVRAFQEGSDPFFLISLKAGGVGLNLTAADHVVHLDPWWNPAVEAQATDRAHRIGQTRTVVAHKLLTEGSIEARLLALQEEKRALAEALLEGGGGAAGRLDLSALKALLAEP